MKRLTCDESGSVYLLALSALLVGVVFALAMLQSSGGYYMGESSRSRSQAAADIAEAGIDYAYWQVHFQGQKLPYSANVSLTTGSFQVSVTDDGARDLSTMLITSTGTCGKYTSTIKRVTVGLLPYDYLWCENQSLDTSVCVSSGGTQGGLRSNSYINLRNHSSYVTTGAWAATTIATAGGITPQYPNSPPIAFPTINYATYDSIANATYNHDVTFNSISTPNTGYIAVVNGNATLNLWSNYSGVCTIVATGNITVNGWLNAANSNSHLALITSQTITVGSGVWLAQVLMYAHNSNNTATINVQAPAEAEIVGSMAADNVNVDNYIALVPDTTLDIQAFEQLQLPGF